MQKLITKVLHLRLIWKVWIAKKPATIWKGGVVVIWKVVFLVNLFGWFSEIYLVNLFCVCVCVCVCVFFGCLNWYWILRFISTGSLTVCLKQIDWFWMYDSLIIIRVRLKKVVLHGYLVMCTIYIYIYNSRSWEKVSSYN